MAKKTSSPNIDNPFVLLQAILLGTIRLIGIIMGWLLVVASLSVKHWFFSLMIAAVVLITLLTFGVISL